MGIEYRIQTSDFERADLEDELRKRGLVVRDTDNGIIGVWESDAQGMPNVEVQTAGDDQTLVLYGGSPAFVERVVGLVLIALAAVNDHVVLSEL